MSFPETEVNIKNMSYITGLVSVVIPTYKRSEMLYRAIESVLNQTYKNVECIVVNDNTPGDEYSQVLYNSLAKYYNDGRFKFIEQKEHKNGAAARNVGIRAAQGEYIAFLDDDDYWNDNKLEIQVPLLKELPEDWGAVSCLMRFFRNGTISSATRPYKDGYIHFEVMSRIISMGTGSLLIRRKALDETGYFDENLNRYQDPQLFSCLTEKYKVKLIKKYLHNRDVDDTQNRPTTEKINAYQAAFFKSLAPQFEKLPKRKVKIAETLYNFDKMSINLREGNKSQALKYALSLLKYPEVIYYTFMRVFNRYYNQIFLKLHLSKYS